jgi:hypothetical protein
MKIRELKSIQTDCFCTECHAGKNKYLSAYLEPTNEEKTNFICNTCGSFYDCKDYNNNSRSFELDKDKSIQWKEVSLNRINTDRELSPIILPIIYSFFHQSREYLSRIKPTIIFSNSPIFLSCGVHTLATSIGCNVHTNQLNLIQVHNATKEYLIQKTNVDKNSIFNYIILTEVYNGPEDYKNFILEESTILCLRNNSQSNLAYPKIFSLT